MLKLKYLMVFALIFSMSPGVAVAQEAAEISGEVVTEEGTVVNDAQVTVPELRQRVRVDGAGRFRFTNVPPGDYLLEVSSLRHGRGAQSISVDAGEDASVRIVLEHVAHSDEIVVTTTAFDRSQLDVAVPSTVLTGDDLQASLQGTLGETLAGEAGVNSTFFGPGASRPVVRGLGGDRVRMLESGVDVGDASSVSPDHNVSTEPAHAQRIEVLRGPATLLYGSSAIGGVVNVIDGLIPSVQGEAEFGGHVDLRLGSVNDESSLSASVGGAAGDWGWHLQGLRRDTDDYDIPGFAEVEGLDEDHDEEHHDEEHGEEHEGEEEHEEEHEEEEAFGTVPNTFTETTSLGLGFSRFFDNGFVGFSVSSYDSDYGVPGGHGHGEEHGHEGEEEEHEGEEEHDDDEEHHDEEEEGGVTIDMQRLRFDARAEVATDFAIFSGWRARLGVVDYEHDEVEPSGEIGTTFFNDSFEGRFELIQKGHDGHSGSWGLQLRQRELEAVGEEAFIPRNESTNLAIFTFQEFDRGRFIHQLGARFESQDSEADLQRDRSFSGFSASAGTVWKFAEGWALAGSLARSVKFPGGEELYSNGPHFATQAFEVGNLDLDEETSVGLDLSLRRTEGRVTGELTAFRNDFSDYIFQEFTGAEEDGLPELAYTQADADFSGFELEVDVELLERGHNHLGLELLADSVRAELADPDTPLPRIPADRLGIGLHFENDRWNARLDAMNVDDQSRLAPRETPTEGYTLVNASVGYRFFTSGAVYDLLLRGRNLTDEDARNHVSFLKDRVPLPGRDLSLSLRMTF